MKRIKIQLLLLILCDAVCMAQSYYSIQTRWIESETVVSKQKHYYKNDTLMYSVDIDSQDIRDTITAKDYWNLGILNFSFGWKETLRSKGIKIEHCELSPMDFERIALMVDLLNEPERRKNDKTKKGKRTICLYGPIEVLLKYSSPSRIKKEILIVRNGLIVEETTVYSSKDIMGKRKERRKYYYDSQGRLTEIEYGKGSELLIIYE